MNKLERLHNQSRLGLIMDTLQVSGQELAAAIHVDNTLVSKWKNKRRTLTLGSEHVNLIAEFLLASEDQQGVHIIADLLKQIEPEITTKSLEDKVKCLGRWLTDSVFLSYADSKKEVISRQPDGSYEASIRIWQGNEGKRSAVLFFLNEVLSINRKVQLLLVSQESMNWLTEDHDFLRKWQHLLMQILKRGHHIKIIHWVDRNPTCIDSILDYWIPLHLTGQIESWFLPMYVDPTSLQTIFVANQAMALTGITSADAEEAICTSLVRDPLSLSQYTSVFYGMQSQCKQLIQICPPERFLPLIDDKLSALPVKGDQLISCYYPLFLTMPLELFCDVLRANNVDNAVFEQIVGCYKRFHQHNTNASLTNATYLAIPEEGFIQYISEQVFFCHYLSLLVGKPIEISQDHRVDHVYHMIEILRTSSEFRLGLAPQLDTYSLWITENDSVLVWSNQAELSHVAHVVEPTVVKSFFDRYRRKWLTIPRIKRNVDQVTESLGSVLKFRN